MGMDIDLYVEWIPFKKDPPFHKNFDVDAIQVFGGDRIYVARDYRLFSCLSGRSGSDDPLYAPRGLPANISLDLLPFLAQPIEGNQALIEKELGLYDLQYISKNKAQQLTNILHGNQKFVNLQIHEQLYDKLFITNNGYDHSYLYYEEILRALTYAGLTPDDCDGTFKVVLELLKSIDSEFGANKSRIVFCFDE